MAYGKIEVLPIPHQKLPIINKETFDRMFYIFGRKTENEFIF